MLINFNTFLRRYFAYLFGSVETFAINEKGATIHLIVR